MTNVLMDVPMNVSLHNGVLPVYREYRGNAV
jgi:hypothetical protein